MARFNNKPSQPTTGVRLTSSVIKTKKNAQPTLKTGNGALAFKRTKKSELFLLGVSNFVGTNSFYEARGARDDRYAKLCAEVAVSDMDWFDDFITWLRNDANMRTAALVGAVHGAVALIKSKKNRGEISYPRRFIRNACARADEPGEILAFYYQTYGRNVPAAIKKGVADAANKLYTEYSLLKYDTDSRNFRFADVINLVHPVPINEKQQQLFRFALDRRYQSNPAPGPLLITTRRNQMLRQDLKTDPSLLLDPDVVSLAGMTWEDVLSLGGQNADLYTKAELWEAVIPNMGYMATLRNLRNFESATISQNAQQLVVGRLTEPEAVSKSRQLPFRFYAAYKNTASLKYQAALEEALELSLQNVPELPGRSLILVDMSGSMFWSHNENTDMTFADTAKLFGTALALRAENADLIQYGTEFRNVSFRKGASILPILDKFHGMGGTNTVGVVEHTYNQHDRVIILTDEQHSSHGRTPGSRLPSRVPLYTWNLVGYRAASEKSNDYRHTFGGLSDQSFAMISLIESGLSQGWPWES